ncbi:MAG: hypothetical protein JWM30_2586 [Burkholderia sp.]|jgi:hypothetical protein|nr:hypothetical protein [Burkholderia sp.]
MNAKLKNRTDLIVQSFAYVAGKLAQSADPQQLAALHEEVLGEAEKHRSALRLMQRDVVDSATQGLRTRTLSEARFRRVADAATRTINLAQDAITRIVSQYAPHRMAA